MSNSSLVSVTKLSPNNSGARTEKISKITVHHMAGVLSVETCGNVFSSTARAASSNYGIGNDGRVGLYVPEEKRSWCSSSSWNDQRAVTIEVSNCSTGGDWPVSEAAWKTLVKLCVDIIERNPGIVRKDGKTPGLYYDGTKNGSLTEHNMFASTGCPGSYLHKHLEQLVEEVNAMLDGKTPSNPVESKPVENTTLPEINNFGLGGIYEVQVYLNIRTAPTTDSSKSTVVDHFSKGATVTLDKWSYQANGWIWGRYTGLSSGKKRYIAVRSVDGKTVYAKAKPIATVLDKVNSKPKVSYTAGKTYTTVSDGLRVRTGPGTSYRQKTKSELTADGKKHSYDNGTLKPSTKVTALEVKSLGNQWWARIPSGWICLNDNGKAHVK